MTSEPTAEAVCENCEGTKIVFRSVPRGPCPVCQPREEPEADAVAAALEDAWELYDVARDAFSERSSFNDSAAWEALKRAQAGVLAAAQPEAPRVSELEAALREIIDQTTDPALPRSELAGEVADTARRVLAPSAETKRR